MANLSLIKARKEYKCRRCGAVIAPGDKYYKVEMMRHPVQHRCIRCKPRREELTSSDYLQWLYHMQDSWYEDYNLDVEAIGDDMQQMLDKLQERFDNIPEQLQDGEAGSLLSDRIDGLLSALDELDNIDTDDAEKITRDDLDADEIEGLDEEEINQLLKDKQQEAQDDKEQEIEDAIQSAIDYLVE